MKFLNRSKSLLSVSQCPVWSTEHLLRTNNWFDLTITHLHLNLVLDSFLNKKIQFETTSSEYSSRFSYQMKLRGNQWMWNG